MPRNDQVTRQWFLILKLQGRHGATLKDLAAALPYELSRNVRTIRRDLEALEASFPIFTDKVNGETHWKLVEGFNRIPPLAFTATELMALVLSRDMLKPLEGTHIKASLDSALNKASSALPTEALEYVRQLQESLSVGLGAHKKYRAHKQTIEQLTRAVANKRTVQMRYFSASRNKTNRRQVDPYRLWYMSGALYLVGYCHLRKDVRLFAIDRIRALSLTNKPCQLPLGFDLDAYVENALVVMRGEPVEVELRFDRKTAPWVKDREWHASQSLILRKNGELTMKLSVSDTRELVGWILSFGSGVRVARPESLRDKVREEAQRIFHAA